MWSIVYLITGAIFIALLIIVFFSKKKIDSEEIRCFKVLIVANLVEYISEGILHLLFRAGNIDGILTTIISKSYLILILFWGMFFTLYVTVLCFKSDKYIKLRNILRTLIGISFVVGFILIIALPEVKFHEADVVYIYGSSVDALKAFSFSYIIIWVVLVLCSRDKWRNKVYIPIYINVSLLIIGGIVQGMDPSILISSVTTTIVCYTMYFTIENPDIKMLNEMYKNKELMEQNYEDKYNFLFEMTQEARSPLININNLSNALRMEDDKDKIKEGLLTMGNLVRQLDFSINDILNISSLDVQRIKVINNKYELEKLCRDLETKIKPEMKPGVKFQLTMPKQLPILFGDYIKIRQILYSLLVNACKNTNDGHINMSVNLIEKYDVARLIFNISDTGSGIPIEQINDILSSTGSLEKQEIENLEKKEYNVKLCQKVVKIMGGNLMIKSNLGEGTDVILTIDQKVFHEKDKTLLTQYENSIANYRRVLIVAQNKDKLNAIKKRLTDNHITYSSLYYGADAIDRIKSGKKFDFILIDDEMAEMTGFMTFEGMKKIKGFNMPVVIMLKGDKEHIKEHYLEDGFSDYLLLDNLDSELDRIMEKY